ncbi:kinase-like domain-containing protein [Xylariaceae sp. AK1471]|nr:kinase-like domain-containing protein [Xylariaceae sp. AK1471]
MVSVSTTKSVAKFILKSSTISPTTPHTLRNVSNAIVPKLRAALAVQELHRGDPVDIGGVDPVQHVTLLAIGGYNSVWLVKLHHKVETTSTPINGDASDHDPTSSLTLLVDKFVIRLPCEDALIPYQVTNEVAFRQFVASRLPRIPVPRVFLFEATDRYDTSFIAEEFIHGSNLSSAWMILNPIRKWILAHKLAKITVDLADVEFGMIGGLNPTTFSFAPTVEGPKIFKGRHKFHEPECYPIGPYHSTKEYILACYDREIYYYSHALAANIDTSLFEKTSVQSFIDQLREKRQALAVEKMDDEPFVLVHGDFHGRNILVRGCRIVAVLDWEFAGSYPLSEALSGGGIDVVDPDSEELDEENTVWGRKIRRYIHREVRLRAWSRKIRRYVYREVKSRAWSRDEIDLLLGDGNQELGKARIEMFP